MSRNQIPPVCSDSDSDYSSMLVQSDFLMNEDPRDGGTKHEANEEIRLLKG